MEKLEKAEKSDRRSYLVELASDYREILGADADIIINNAKEFSDEEVETFIAPFEKAKRRENMIEQGRGEEVLAEIKESDDNKKVVARKKELAERELQERESELDKIERILSQIHSA